MGDWDDFLLRESGLPGPRGNLELAQAVADEGDEARFRRYLAFGPERAPTGSQQEFLAFCGLVGLGRLAAEGRSDLLPEIRRQANDPRWRLREATAMALQRLGLADMELLLEEIEGWIHGSWLEQRAAAASLAEPALLLREEHAERVLRVLDAITGNLAAAQERHVEDYKVLRQGLGYCWSVATAALPGAGKRLMEKWLDSADPDVRWVMKENLKKKRLARMDQDWVEACLARLEKR